MKKVIILLCLVITGFGYSESTQDMIKALEDLKLEIDNLGTSIEGDTNNPEDSTSSNPVTNQTIIKPARIGSYYQKTGDDIYFIETAAKKSKKIKNVDADNFDTYKGSLYAGDMKDVYYKGDVVRRADPDTFEIINVDLPEYARDKSNVYYKGEIIKKADLETFEPLGGSPFNGYAKDRNNVYLNTDILKGVDASTFVLFNSMYSKDKNNVYYSNKKIEKADAATFEYYEGLFYYDKNYIYSNGKIIKKVN